jgi:hypothetical protein
VTAGAFLTNGASGTAGQEAIRINNDNGYIGFFNGANNTRSGYLQGNTTDVTLTTSPSTPLILGTANTERMRITSGGNVGIGTTSPQARLQVNGNFRLYTTNDDGNELRGIFGVGGAADPLTFTMYKADATTIGNFLTAEGTSYFNSGNVGIGTTSPVQKLTVIGLFGAPATSGTAQDGIARFGQSSGNGCLDFGFGDPYSWIQSRDASSYATNYNLSLQPNGGNVGIGTTSPSQKLQVAGGNVLINNGSSPDSNSGLRIVAPISTTHFNWMLAAQQNVSDAFEITPSTAAGGTTFNSPKLVVKSDGNVGIGTTSPSQKLEVNGNIKTAAPAGYTAKPYKLGEVLVGAASADSSVVVEIDGTVFFLLASTNAP